MSNKYRIDLIEGIVVIRFNDMPGAKDVIDAIKEVTKLENNKLRLWDIRKGFMLSSDELRNIAFVAKSMNFQPSRIAVLAQNDVSFGLARMAEVFRQQDNQEYRVFRTEQKAIEWLLENKT